MLGYRATPPHPPQTLSFSNCLVIARFGVQICVTAAVRVRSGG